MTQVISAMSEMGITHDLAHQAYLEIGRSIVNALDIYSNSNKYSPD
jgi:hypothetical protein